MNLQFKAQQLEKELEQAHVSMLFAKDRYVEARSHADRVQGKLIAVRELMQEQQPSQKPDTPQ